MTGVPTSPSLPPAPQPQLSLTKLFLKTSLWTLIFLFGMFIITAGVGVVYLWSQAQIFARTANVELPALAQQINQGWQQTPTQTQGRKIILLLGVDTLAGRGNAPPLTDTMALLAVNFNDGTITSLPIPRDLWSQEYQTKINALYWYGQDRYPEQPQQFPTEVITQLTGLPIHHTVVLSLDQVSELIDLLGGVEINVETGFVDHEFPRPGVEVATEHDPTKLYMTVEFQPGPQIMNGERALQFMRSRHSGDDEGDDVARGRRQQQVIGATIAAITSPQNLKNPVLLGHLYQWYSRFFSNIIPLPEAVATAKALLPVRRQLVFTGQSLGVYPDDETGLLIHPPVTAQYQNQWVYTIREPATFARDVQARLGITQL